MLVDLQQKIIASIEKEVTGRIGWEEYFLKQAILISERSTCTRVQVGVVLTNKNNKVLATGYNGVPRGQVHCKDYFFKYFVNQVLNKQFPYYIDTMHFNLEEVREAVYGKRYIDMYKDWLTTDEFRQLHGLFSAEREIHAEQNAFAGVARDELEDGKMFCTLSPCSGCSKMIVATGVKEFYYLEKYDRDDGSKAINFLKQNSVKIQQVKI